MQSITYATMFALDAYSLQNTQRMLPEDVSSQLVSKNWSSRKAVGN